MKDRFYTSDQFSNTVSVVDPATNTLLGVIRLGDPTPMNLSPLYKGQLLVHGMGFSPDHKTLLVVSIGSNSVSFIDTATNAVRQTAYVGRSPHEAFFTSDGKEVWVSIRGEDYIAVLDAGTAKELRRIAVPNGPGMTIFSPDGAYGYVCSSFSPETVVVDTKSHAIVGRMKQESPFCPDIAATPDGAQVWFTLKDVGRTQVFEARPPFKALKTIDTGPITNHVNVVRTKAGQFAYVTVGGLNIVKVFRTDDFAEVATIPTGALPHGLWPSGDGSRVYVGLENADKAAVIDTATNTVIAEVPIGQGPQGVAYVPNAVPEGDGRQPSAARSRRQDQCADARGRRRQAGDAGHPVRSGPAPDPPGGRHRPNGQDAVRAGSGRRSEGSGKPRAAGRLHDQPGGSRHRQRDRADPPTDPHRGGREPPLPRGGRGEAG